ncbi:MAG: hypothetical protein AB7V50_08530 [Vampirovibrionia bacterium]
MKKVLTIYKHSDTLIIRFPELSYDCVVSKQVKASLPNLIIKYRPKAIVFDLKSITDFDNEGVASIMLSWNICCSRNIKLILCHMDSTNYFGVTTLIDTKNSLQDSLQLAVDAVVVDEIHNVVTKKIVKVFGDPVSSPITTEDNKIVRIKQKLLAVNKEEVLTA